MSNARAEALRVHGPWALVSGMGWAATFFIPYETSFRFCGFLRLTGYPCMFCGWTRSFGALSDGAWAFAVSNAPLVLALYAGMVALFFWNTTALVSHRVLVPSWWLRIRGSRWAWALMAALILMNWIYRLNAGFE